MTAHPDPAEQRKLARATLFIGVLLALISLIVIPAQVPWLLRVYHGPRPITAAEFRPGGGQPTQEYVAFDVSESVEADVAVGYQGGILSRYLFVRIGDEWVFAHVPTAYHGGALAGYVRRSDDPACGREREALGRVAVPFPDRPLLPYIIQANGDEKEELLAFFKLMGLLLAFGLVLACPSYRWLVPLPGGRHSYGHGPDPLAVTDRVPRRVTGGLCLLIIAGLLVGATAFGKYTAAEHRRLSFWDEFWVCFGEVVALAWAMACCARLVVPSVYPGPPRPTGFLWAVTLAGALAGLGTDIWKTTAALVEPEREAFGPAVRTVGTVHSVTATWSRDGTGYWFHCSYKDSNRIAYRADFFVRDPDELPNLAPEVGAAVRAERLPVPIAIAYAGDRPQHSCLADQGWGENGRVPSGFSVGVLLFQVIVTVSLFMALAGALRSTGRLPDVPGLAFGAVEAGFALFIGGLVLIKGFPVVWGGWEDL